MRILFVEDNARFSAVVVREFLAAHDVTVAPTLLQARWLLKQNTFDAALLDGDLPDGFGEELLEELHAAGLRGRVVAVSVMAAHNARLLDMGAVAAVGKLEFARIGEVLE